MQSQVRNDPTAPGKRVFVVDDHAVLRFGLSRLIGSEPGFVVCGEAVDAPSALRAISRLQPDVVIIDISLQGTDGLELLKQIRATGTAVPVLVLSMYEETLYAERALRAGANGYIMKREATEVLLTALRRITEGGIYVSEQIAGQILKHFASSRPGLDSSPTLCLSDRELEVFRRIGEGHRTRQIAEALDLSVKTVETYRSRIRKKLSIEDPGELLHRAFLWTQGNE